MQAGGQLAVTGLSSQRSLPPEWLPGQPGEGTAGDGAKGFHDASQKVNYILMLNIHLYFKVSIITFFPATPSSATAACSAGQGSVDRRSVAANFVAGTIQ
jgi:hypothetical protein